MSKMPGIAEDDWVGKPTVFIQSLYDEKSDLHVTKVKDFFSKKLQETDSSMIPSLNDTPLHDLQTNTLVRMRCMVQDMYDPEFFLGKYEVRNTQTGQTKIVSGLFRDLAECEPNEVLKLDSPNCATLDRQSFYCVPIPGENEWVKKAYAPVKTQAPSTSGIQQTKRPLEDDDDTDNMNAVEGDGATTNTEASADVAMDMEEQDSAASGDTVKEIKVADKPGTSGSANPDLNFPLPDEKGPACMVKMYEETDLKLNEIIEVVGVLSNDPALATFPNDERNGKSSFLDPASELMDVAEEQAHCPPPSLVPRLHAIVVNKLKHNNPLLPADLEQESSQQAVDNIKGAIKETRQKLFALLSQALFGDVVAAEILLCHLISSVYARHDFVPLGKYSMNLSSVPRNSTYSKHMYSLLELLVEKSHYLPMKIPLMNKAAFYPKKDYKLNRLQSGRLQLSDHTHLVIDETVMEEGKLEPQGVKNLEALGNVAVWQKVLYDFEFHTQEFPTNINVLILSEGKALMQCDTHVSLAPRLPTDNLDVRFSNIQAQLTEELLNQIRTYLGIVRRLPYKLAEDVQKTIEEDFVEMRKVDPKNFTVEDFQTLLRFNEGLVSQPWANRTDGRYLETCERSGEPKEASLESCHCSMLLRRHAIWCREKKISSFQHAY